jgi:hypothetical protein
MWAKPAQLRLPFAATFEWREKKLNQSARVPISDEKLIARLQNKVPQLSTPASEVAFEAVIDNLLS